MKAIGEFRSRGRTYKTCNGCRADGQRYWREQRAGEGRRYEQSDPEVVARLERMRETDRATWEELVGLPGGLAAVESPRQTGDGRRWVQLI